MKFIAADPSEKRYLPSDIIENCIFVTGLEALTGADFLITPSKIPINEKTLPIHIAKGIGIQRKNSPDFIASFMDNDSRLWRQLIRMLHTWPPQQQKQSWLITVGYFGQHTGIDEFGNKVRLIQVAEHKSGVRYKSYAGALTSWQLHGGYYQPIPGENLLLEWCQIMYARLLKREIDGKWGTTLLTRSSIKPLELLTGVETTLCTIPGLGTERARAVYTEAQKYWDRPTLIDCFRIMKDNKIEGIGDKTKNAALKFIGWGNGESK